MIISTCSLLLIFWFFLNTEVSLAKQKVDVYFVVIVKATNGPRYVVGCRRQLDKTKLKAGTRVALDMTTLTIMRFVTFVWCWHELLIGKLELLVIILNCFLTICYNCNVSTWNRLKMCLGDIKVHRICSQNCAVHHTSFYLTLKNLI